MSKYSDEKRKYIERMRKGMSSSDSYLIMVNEFAKQNDHETPSMIYDDVLKEAKENSKRILSTISTGRI